MTDTTDKNKIRIISSANSPKKEGHFKEKFRTATRHNRAFITVGAVIKAKAQSAANICGLTLRDFTEKALQELIDKQ